MRTRPLGLGNTTFMPRVVPRLEIEILTQPTVSGSLGIGYFTGNNTFTNVSRQVVAGQSIEEVAQLFANISGANANISVVDNKIIFDYTNTTVLTVANANVGQVMTYSTSDGVTTDFTLERGRATSSDMYGYYGKYQGIYTPNEIITLGAITEGTTKDDDFNDPEEDITWLKFSHNYKTLFVADRTIHYAISWNHLESLGLVFGKVVEKDGQKYMLRLMQGANVNPASAGGGLNDEWNSLIVQFTPNQEDSNWGTGTTNIGAEGRTTICQETSASDITRYVQRGYSSVDHFLNGNTKINNITNMGYRPVLEVL